MKAPLVIPAGIVSDDTSFSSTGRWKDGNNMRPHRGAMQTIGGWSLLSSGYTGVCRGLSSWTDNDGNVTIALGTHSNLYVRRNGVDYDITPLADFTAGAEHGAGGPGFGAGAYGAGTYGGGVTTAYYALTWSLANWGQNLLANPRGQSVFIWENDPGTEATRIANAPDVCNAMIMTDQRQVMVAGTNEEVSGDFNAMCIRWSDIQDYDQWTTGAGTNQSAGEYIIREAGELVTLRNIGPYVAVWSNKALYLGQYIGAEGEIWRFERVAEHCGLIGPNAVCILNQTAFWITPDCQFYTWTVGFAPQLVPCPIRSDFKDNLVFGQKEKIAATTVAQFGEVWWFYPDSRDGNECSRYVAYSVPENAWFRGDMARTAGMDAGSNQFPLFISPDGYGYWHENGQTANGGVLEWSLRSAAQYIEEGGRFVLVRGLWPDFKSQQGAVSATFYLRKYPQDTTVYEKGPYTLAVNTSKKDFLYSGRVVEVEFSGASSPSFARLGKPVFDVVPSGTE